MRILHVFDHSLPLHSGYTFRSAAILGTRVREAVLGETLADTGWFDTRFLREMVGQHQSGLRDYSTSLWTLLMFEAFLRGSNDWFTRQKNQK